MAISYLGNTGRPILAYIVKYLRKSKNANNTTFANFLRKSKPLISLLIFLLNTLNSFYNLKLGALTQKYPKTTQNLKSTLVYLRPLEM